MKPSYHSDRQAAYAVVMASWRRTTRTITALLLLGTVSVPVSAQEPPRQSAPQARAVVDAAVRAGHVESQVRDALLAAIKNGQSVRALVVTSSTPLAEDASAQAQQDTGAAHKAEIAATQGVEIENLLPSLNTTVVTINSVEGLAGLASMPDATIVADKEFQRMDASSEAYVSAPTVRNYGYDGAGYYIGIIDSGVDYTHPDLGSCAYPGAPAPCRVALLPPDFSRVSTGGPLFDDGTLDDSIRHGTNVAATASFMARGARIIGADVFGAPSPTTGRSSAFASDIAAAIQYMINLKASGYPIVAVNLSLGFSGGGGCPDVLGITALRNAGIVPVAAAGNSGYVGGAFVTGLANPACVPSAVSVGATFDGSISGSATFSGCTNSTTAADTIACFSQTSSGLSMLAPGVSVSGGGLTMSGTSQAAPHVAGAIAALASAVPQATATDLVAGVIASQTRVFDSRIGLSFPRLSMLDALAETQNRLGVFGPDSFDRAIYLSGTTSGSVSTAAGFTAQSSETGHGRRSGISSTWFFWIAPASGRATFSTGGSSFDTAMSIYQGTAINALAEVGWNDDSSIAGTHAVLGPLEVTGGTSYRIAVTCGAATSSCGAINMSWTFSVDTTAPVNDLRANAMTLSGPSGTVSGTNSFAAAEPGEFSQPGVVAAQKSVWFRFESSGPSTLSLSTAGSTFDTRLSVFRGPDPLNLRFVDAHNDVGTAGAKFDATSRLSFTTERLAATYWVAVDSAVAHTGALSLSWSVTPGGGAPQSVAVVASPRASAAPAANIAPGTSRQPAAQA